MISKRDTAITAGSQDNSVRNLVFVISCLAASITQPAEANPRVKPVMLLAMAKSIKSSAMRNSSAVNMIEQTRRDLLGFAPITVATRKPP